VSADAMISEWERMKKDVFVAYFKTLFQHFLGGTIKRTKHLNQESRFLGQDLNQTSQIQSSWVTHPTTTFSAKFSKIGLGV
jgi:hypothetical protein